MDDTTLPLNGFTPKGVWRGFIIGQPLTLGTLTYGIAFGLLAGEIGLSALEAVLMSAAVYSGSAQLAALTMMQDASPWTNAGLSAMAATIIIVNARYFLYGATLRPWLGQATPVQAYSTLFILGDGNWILSTRAHQGGEHDAGFILGSGLAMFLGWVIGTLLGSLLGVLLSNPALLGLDFLLVSFCAAASVAMFGGQRDIVVLIAAAACSLLVSTLASGGWPIIAAGVAGAVVAYVRQLRSTASQ